MNAKIETFFACLIVLQFAVVVSHDWLDIPGWTHGRCKPWLGVASWR
jgi:hypothetical protein